MWFSLFAAVLILAIAFYEGLQGVFTALINCILAVLAAALSFAVYEDLYFAFLKDRQPDHGRAIMLLGMFIISLLVLRTLFDMFIKNNLRFPLYVDRIGGGVFGFFTGMIIVGMLSIGFEMLPFGDSFLTYSRQQFVDSDGKPVPDEELAGKDLADLKYERKSAWLKQDDFTVALVSHLSSNALHGRQTLSSAYPNLLDDVYFYQARMVKNDLPTGDPKTSIEVKNYWEVRDNEFFDRQKVDTKDGRKQYKLVPCKVKPEAGYKRIAVRVAFVDTGKVNFTARQVRLVYQDGADGGAVGESYAVGISEEKAANKLVRIWDGEVYTRDLGKKGKNLVDFVFEVPSNVEFDPEGSFVEFKYNSRDSISPEQDLGKKRPKAPTPEPKEEGDEAGSEGSADSGKQRPSGVSNSQDDTHGRTHGIGPAREALVSDELPFDGQPLTEYGGNPEVNSGAMRGGHVVATLADDWKPAPGGTASPISKIYVPADYRLVQVSVEKLQPGSYLGRAKGFVVDNLRDFYLIDSRGEKHLPVGMYGMAKVSGKCVFEMVLLNEDGRIGDAVMAKLPNFERIKRANFTGEYALYFLYQVKPGTQIKSVHTDGANDIPLESYNLTAD